MKRAQLSIELLLIFLIFTSCFVLLIPQIVKAKQIADHSIAMREASLVLDTIYYACERTAITGSRETIKLHTSKVFSIISKNNSLTVFFDNINGTANISKDLSFECSINPKNLTKGLNYIYLGS